RAKHLRGIDVDVKLGPLAALDEHARHARQSVQARFDLVRRQLPEFGLRHRVGGQAVADDREARKIETVRPNLHGRAEAALEASHGGVDHLERQDHVDAPVEEQVDLGGPAARHRADRPEAGHASDRLFDRPRDRHLHLLDRHDAVVDADDDPRKIRRRKHGDRQRQRLVDADHGENADEEDHRCRMAREPVALGIFAFVERFGQYVSSGSSSSFAGAICTLTFDRTSGSSLNSSNAPVVATRCPLSRPSVICTLPPSRTPTATLRRCGLLSLSMTIANVEPWALVRTAFSGMTSALDTVLAIISTRRLLPGRSVPSRFSACTPTSTLRFVAARAGVICPTFAATGAPPGAIRFASLPTFSSAASACDTCVRAITCDRSITVTTGCPPGGVSPA